MVQDEPAKRSYTNQAVVIRESIDYFLATLPNKMINNIF
jgi:hypothetical protein